jgi:type III secretion protein J
MRDARLFRRPTASRRLAAVGLLALAACSVPVASDLDDSEANRVFVALSRVSIDATKEPDPTAEGKWRVDVARDDVPRALSAMREEQLPRRAPLGVLDSVGKGALVPSDAAEHAQLMAGVAGDLQRTIEGVDGILSARVHVSVPPTSLLREPIPARATAGVLVEHRGATPPLSADSVQRLVAGGVAGLLPADVAVVMVARSAASRGADMGGGLAHIGPIAVARTSMRQLQAALVALVAVVALLAIATLLLYSRLSRARAALAREAPAPR